MSFSPTFLEVSINAEVVKTNKQKNKKKKTPKCLATELSTALGYRDKKEALVTVGRHDGSRLHRLYL